MKKIGMCKFYNPKIWRRCDKGRRGTLACHTDRSGDCPDYEPSESKIERKNHA